MAEVTVAFGLGAETVTVVVPVDLPSGGTPLAGDVSGTFGDCFISGDVNQTGDVFVEGLLTGVDTFHWQGNGFTVFFQNGGQSDLHGKVKGRWGEWGTGSPRSADTTGWLTGDRLAVAATAYRLDAAGNRLVTDFLPSEKTWAGWSGMTRPVNSPDVPQVDGSVRRPEVLNLSQSIVFENLARGFHFHDSAGIQTLSDVKFLNCGTAGVLGNYPVHFHLLADNSRGTVLTRVVVEGGKNHAFVPHGSHGISFPGCAAYNTTGVAYWWDLSTKTDLTNDSNDINWDDCLSMWSKNSTLPGESGRLAGFWLGSGTGLSCNRSVACCIDGSGDRAGFNWPEKAGRTSWAFHDCLAHNVKGNGIFVWQNADDFENEVDNFTAYRCGAGISHGAYINRYQYRGAVLTGNGIGFIQAAKSTNAGPLNVEDVLSDGPLVVGHHNAAIMLPTFFRRDTFPQVIYKEPSNGSYNRYEDCGLTPSDFVLTGAAPLRIAPTSIIEVWEAGVLEHRWASGVWS